MPIIYIYKLYIHNLFFNITFEQRDMKTNIIGQGMPKFDLLKNLKIDFLLTLANI